MSRLASGGVAIATDNSSTPSFQVSPERMARRDLVDRENMRLVRDGKPVYYRMVKRLADIVLSSGALVVFSPVMIGAAIAIMIVDGRPIIYAAPREGINGKPFKMYKFRSMYRDADSRLKDLLSENEQKGPAFKIENDPRITTVGRFIRRTSIDELPQLVNIIKGDMSIVGPRAIQRTRDYSAHEAQRLLVKPGLTCYWQVMGRSKIDWDNWVELDLDYIQDMSLWTDFKIILKTFGAVLREDGSY